MINDRRAPNRLPATFLQRINPIWWLGDVERNPNWSRWQWFKRNPCANFAKVIIGIAHKERDCYWEQSPLTWNPSGGDNDGYTIVVGKPNRKYKFKSHRGPKWEWCIGWKTSGTYSITFRRSRAPNATEGPE